MRILGKDHTYYGFVYIYGKGNYPLDAQAGEHCSQIVWEYSKDHSDGLKIKFYFPNDWLITQARSKPFLEDFCKVVTSMFQPVKYLGKFESKDIEQGPDIKKLNEQFGYNYISNDKGKKIISPASYVKNNGDLIINDMWRGFEIDISGIKNKRAMLAYSSFCLIRYLFCSHYHEIVDTFLYLRKVRSLVDSTVTDFELLQMAHYSSLYMPSPHNGFFNQMQAGATNGYAYKLKSLTEFKEAFNTSSSLNSAFVGLVTKVTIREIQEHFAKQELKKIYEKLK
jgi:hypothetical protein